MKTAMKLLMGCAVTCLCGALALAEPPKKAEPARKATATAPGMVVVKDKVTGEIRQATPAEIGELQNAAKRTTVVRSGTTAATKAAPAVVKSAPGGATGAAVDESLDVYTVVTRTPDGKLVMGCVTGKKAADEAVSKGVKREALDEK